MAKDTKEPEVVVVEPKYEVAEIAQNAPRLFGYSVDIATAAFDVAHVKQATLAEARTIIKNFAERKVN